MDIIVKVPEYGEAGYPGDVYEINRKHSIEQTLLSNAEKLVLLKSIKFKLQTVLYRCPKYVNEQARIQLQSIDLLIKDLIVSSRL